MFKVLYIFSGTRRKADLRHWLERGGKTANLEIIVEEVDVLHGAEHDLLNEEVWKKLKQRIQANEFKP